MQSLSASDGARQTGGQGHRLSLLPSYQPGPRRCLRQARVGYAASAADSAARVVKEQQEAENSDYAIFDLNKDGTKLSLTNFDGLPLINPETNRPLWDNNPIISSQNHAIALGVIFPLDIKFK